MIDVKIHKIYKDDPRKVKALASVTFDGMYAVHGIRIVGGKNGDFISMPSRKSGNDDKYFEVFHPVTSEARKELSDAVMEAYNTEICSQN